MNAIPCSDMPIQNTDGYSGSLLEHLPAAAYICDASGLIVSFNSAAAVLWGQEPKPREPESDIYTKCKLLSSDGIPISYKDSPMAEALRSGTHKQQSLILMRPDGSRSPLIASTRPIDAQEKKGTVTILLETDSGTQPSEQQAKSKFLSRLSHDLRSPMNVVFGLVNIMADNPNSPRQKEFLDTLKASAQQMLELLDNINSFAQPEPPKEPRPVSHPIPTQSPVHQAESRPFTDKNETYATFEISNDEKDSNRTIRILIVEDYYANVVVATSVLSFFGYDYVVANNGREAIERFEQEHFDLILMDVQMPEIDGYEATRIIRECAASGKGKKIPIIGMTAHVMQTERDRCLQSGMNDYISKPFQPSELKAKLDQFIKRVS